MIVGINGINIKGEKRKTLKTLINLLNNKGITFAWIGDGFSNPFFLRAERITSESPSSSNVGTCSS